MSTPPKFFLRASFLAALFCLVMLGMSQTAKAAADLPLTSESLLAGIGFDDKPLYLPVQKNFQMAMLTAGSELGRTCGKMEAFGWRMTQSEQSRVDQIFNATVDRFRGLGYEVEMQNPSSISSDITMYTADRANKHFLSMWSAGEIGLVMVLCETSAPSKTHTAAPVATMQTPSVETYPDAVKAMGKSSLLAPLAAAKNMYAQFSPVGTWAGSYVCGQGYTGATLSITSLRGDNFEGSFHFYPTAKNPNMPEGRYTVYGQYDRESQRILINPGRWLKRPTDYYNTIIVGSFDASNNTLSAFFQGITGCTSFEARLDKYGKAENAVQHHKHVVKKAKKKVAKAPSVVVPAMVEAVRPADAAATAAPAIPAAALAPASSTPVATTLPAPVQESAPAAAPVVAPSSQSAAPAAPSEPTVTPAQEKPALVVGAPTPAAAAK